MITIAWDVDDVLNDFMRLWFEQCWRTHHTGCSLGYADLKENPPHKLLGVDLEEYLASLDAFRLSDAFAQMNPLQETQDWFLIYGERFRHIALTAVPLSTAPDSAGWVLRNFGNWIRTFHVVPAKRKCQKSIIYDRDKIEYLTWSAKIDFVIDDNEPFIKEATAMGVKGILIPRPWNNGKGTIKETLASIMRQIDG